MKQAPTYPRMTDVFNQGTCEVVRGEHPNPLARVCSEPAALRYPAMGGGYMRLCAEHGEKHRAYCAEWLGVQWSCGKWETPLSTDALEASRLQGAGKNV